MVSITHSLVRLAKSLLVIALIVSCSTPESSAAEAVAELDRDTVSSGEGALLSIRVSGSRSGNPEIPEVENLIIETQGRSQQIQMVNGRTTMSVVFQYVVGSRIAGDYQIPAITVNVDGGKLTTEPLRLKVLPVAASQPPAGMPPGTSGSQNPGTGEPASGSKQFGFLTVELAANGRTHAYVGEIAPVRIRAWLPEDSQAQLRGGIRPEAKAFTLHNVNDRPQQSREVRDGKNYTVVTWYGGISATKAGTYPASLSLKATVAVRDPSALKRPSRRTGGFFGGMFDQMNVPMIQKDVTLKSEDQMIEVRPLPTEGRPAGFTGAVGNFKIDAVEIPDTWQSGEPQQMAARITGSGNFALMDAPNPSPADAWKTYPGKDEFTPGDEASFSGAKSFRFSAVPRKGGPQEVALELSFFDPVAGAYKIFTSPAKKIQVAGADIVDPEPVTETAPVTPEKPKDPLIGQHGSGSPAGTLVPLVSRPAFIPLLGSALLLAAIGKLLAWLRIRRSDPARLARAAAEKGCREALQAATRSAESRDVAGFFAAARLAIQHQLGLMWNQPAQAITLAEVSARIPEDSPVARFFREADQIEYHPQPGDEIRPQWRTLLDEALASLSPGTR